MLDKIKDLNKVILNPYDILVKSTKPEEKKSSIIMLEEQKKVDTGEWVTEVLVVGTEVNWIKPGDIVISFKTKNGIGGYTIGNDENVLYSVINMNMIEMLVEKENFETIKL